jgi:hypothetical protein
MIVGWRVASNMRTDMVLDVLEMSRWSRGTRLEGLVTYSDAGSQFTSIRYGERLTEIGAVPSIGSVGDSYDNALAEAVNALYKSELIRGPNQGPWKCVEDVELATLGWVDWHNTDRLHGTQGRAALRVRGGLRCPTGRPGTGWNPINRASTKTQGESESDSNEFFCVSGESGQSGGMVVCQFNSCCASPTVGNLAQRLP